MGYNSSFNLRVDDKHDDIMEFCKLWFDDKSHSDDYKFRFVARALEPYGCDGKWYEYKEYITSISTSFPTVLFQVIRYGEENGDIEKSYFRNGKSWSTKVIMLFEEFDEGKLT